MDGFQFVSSLAGQLAWPVVVLALGFAFKGEVSRLINEVREIEGPKGIRVRREWRQESDEVAEKLSAPEPTIAIDGPEANQRPNPIEVARAGTDPAGAIDAAYRTLAYRLREVSAGGTPTFRAGKPDLRAAAKEAAQAGAVGASTLEAIEGIAVLHDLAMSAPNRVSAAEAREFQLLVSTVMYALRTR